MNKLSLAAQISQLATSKHANITFHIHSKPDTCLQNIYMTMLTAAAPILIISF